MSSDGVNRGRRRFLTLTTSAVGAVGAGFLAVPFLKSWRPSAEARAAGAPVEVDVSKLEPGQMLRTEWRGTPVWIVHRTQRMLEDLSAVADRLRDPDSDNENQQPGYCRNAHRSINPRYYVTVGICTHLGCAPSFAPEVEPKSFDPRWRGGFFCPCHSSMYDLAGRVYDGVPAPANLEVPPHRYLDNNRIVVGEHPTGVA